MKTLLLVGRGDESRGIGNNLYNSYDPQLLSSWILDLQLPGEFNIFLCPSAGAEQAIRSHKGPIVAFGRDAQAYCMKYKGGRSIDLPYPSTINPAALDVDFMRRKLYRARMEVKRRIEAIENSTKSKVKVIK